MYTQEGLRVRRIGVAMVATVSRQSVGASPTLSADSSYVLAVHGVSCPTVSWFLTSEPTVSVGGETYKVSHRRQRPILN